MSGFLLGAQPRLYQTTINETIEGPYPQFLPAGWMELVCANSGKRYYIHKATGRTVFNAQDIVKPPPPTQPQQEEEDTKMPATPEPQPSRVRSSSEAIKKHPVVTPTSMSQPIDLCLSEDDDDDDETLSQDLLEESEDDGQVGVSEISEVTMTQQVTQSAARIPAQILTLSPSSDEEEVALRKAVFKRRRVGDKKKKDDETAKNSN
jgi:hypothetical protein